MKSKTKVLVVDDEPIMINLMESALAEGGYETATATDGLQALEKVKTFQPDVILLDVVMPELNGFEVTERLKSDPAATGISIILVTGLGSIEDRVKGLEAGADDFLSKPFNLDELLIRTRSLARLKKLQDRLAAKEAECPENKSKIDRRSSPLVLVVEDDQRIVRICENILTAGGCQAVDVAGAEQALSFLAEETPDLVILDLMLPDRSGLELLAELRRMPGLEHTGIIVLTALGDLKTKVKGFYLGADDYIVKPVSSMELLARVRANLRKRELALKVIRAA